MRSAERYGTLAFRRSGGPGKRMMGARARAGSRIDYCYCASTGRAVKSCARAARVTRRRAEARKSRIHCSPEHCHTTKGPYTALPLAPRQGGLARYVSVKPHPPSRILTPCRMPCACPMCIPHDRILSRHQQQPSHAHAYVPTCICMNAIPADGRASYQTASVTPPTFTQATAAHHSSTRS